MIQVSVFAAGDCASIGNLLNSLDFEVNQVHFGEGRCATLEKLDVHGGHFRLDATFEEHSDMVTAVGDLSNDNPSLRLVVSSSDSFENREVSCHKAGGVLNHTTFPQGEPSDGCHLCSRLAEEDFIAFRLATKHSAIACGAPFTEVGSKP